MAGLMRVKLEGFSGQTAGNEPYPRSPALIKGREELRSSARTLSYRERDRFIAQCAAVS
jgi:hypothetical protein